MNNRQREAIEQAIKSLNYCVDYKGIAKAIDLLQGVLAEPNQRKWVEPSDQQLCELEIKTKWVGDSRDFDLIAHSVLKLSRELNT